MAAAVATDTLTFLREQINQLYAIDAVERGAIFLSNPYARQRGGRWGFGPGKTTGAGTGAAKGAKGAKAGGAAKATKAAAKATASAIPKTAEEVSHIPHSFSELEHMQSITGPHGSQDGEWKKDGAGHEFYVKPALSESHAYNEVGGMKVYEAMGAKAGVDIPHTAVMHDASGKAYIVSEKLEGVQQKTGGWWSGQGADAAAARAAAEQHFGTDVLLAHWDVAGSGHDNMLLGKDGQPVRIETGGGMQYRAQGALKDSWKVGSAYGEAWTMRGMAHDGVPGNAQDGAIFGHISDQHAGELLGEASKTMQGKLSQIGLEWQAMGMPKAQREANLQVLQDRIARVGEIQKELGYKAPAKAASTGGAKKATTAGAGKKTGTGKLPKDAISQKGGGKFGDPKVTVYQDRVEIKTTDFKGKAAYAKIEPDQNLGGYRLSTKAPGEKDWTVAYEGMSGSLANAYLKGYTGKQKGTVFNTKSLAAGPKKTAAEKKAYKSWKELQDTIPKGGNTPEKTNGKWMEYHLKNGDMVTVRKKDSGVGYHVYAVPHNPDAKSAKYAPYKFGQATHEEVADEAGVNAFLAKQGITNTYSYQHHQEVQQKAVAAAQAALAASSYGSYGHGGHASTSASHSPGLYGNPAAYTTGHSDYNTHTGGISTYSRSVSGVHVSATIRHEMDHTYSVEGHDKDGQSHKDNVKTVKEAEDLLHTKYGITDSFTGTKLHDLKEVEPDKSAGFKIQVADHEVGVHGRGDGKIEISMKPKPAGSSFGSTTTGTFKPITESTNVMTKDAAVKWLTDRDINPRVKEMVDLAHQDGKQYLSKPTQAVQKRIDATNARRAELDQKYGQYSESLAHNHLNQLYSQHPYLKDAVSNHLGGGHGNNLEPKNIAKVLKASVSGHGMTDAQRLAKATEAYGKLHELTEWSILHHANVSREGTVRLFHGNSGHLSEQDFVGKFTKGTGLKHGIPFSDRLSVSHKSFGSGSYTLSMHVPAKAISVWYGLRGPGAAFHDEHEYTIAPFKATKVSVLKSKENGQSLM